MVTYSRLTDWLRPVKRSDERVGLAPQVAGSNAETVGPILATAGVGEVGPAQSPGGAPTHPEGSRSRVAHGSNELGNPTDEVERVEAGGRVSGEGGGDVCVCHAASVPRRRGYSSASESREDGAAAIASRSSSDGCR